MGGDPSLFTDQDTPGAQLVEFLCEKGESGLAPVSLLELGGSERVIVQSIEAWEHACEQSGIRPRLQECGANIFVRGVDFANRNGSKLQLGSALLHIKGGKTKADTKYPQLNNALKKGGHAFECIVITGGIIAPGADAVLGEWAMCEPGEKVFTA